MNAVSPLARTRPPHEAIFRLESNPVKRSEGRSAVAFVAYRAGVKATDERIGKTFDYTRKGVLGNFIAVPANAPEWATNREALWNAVERAEKRPDAQVAREVLWTIPRELPREHWEPLARRLIQPYLDAGCIVDGAFHAPDAADGAENGHFHATITPRAITPEGFARTKCAALEAMFSSGGRYGGQRGEAMDAERARWATEINNTFRALGINARVDNRSRARRGAADLETEPTYGETAAARHRRTQKPSQNQQIVGVMRQRRRAEQAAISTEVAMEHAVQKTSKIPYQQSKQAIKETLLRERYPDLDTARLGADSIYRVDVSSPASTKIVMRDDSMVEVRKDGRILLYGPDGTARQLAEALADAQGWERDAIQRLPPTARAQAQEGRYRRRGTSKEEIERLVAWWQEAGYTDITTSPKGVWIALGPSSRILDSGSTMVLHGALTEDSLRAMVSKAKSEWQGRLEIVSGSEDFKSRLWLEAQRQGVEVQGFDPPEHLKAQAAAEAKARNKEATAVANVANRAEVARDALAFLRGTSSEAPTKEIQAYLESLRKKELAALSSKEPWEIVPMLAGWQASGEAILQQEAAVQAPTPKPGKGGKKDDDEPDQDGPGGPVAPGRR
ncbi:MobA/MobL family protein [Caenispirillum bisanense]|uniref:MobA/MobL family protein n=1 Tax=Caenispirillum bisanense TaxID=414052 RepID=UPI0031E101E8